MARFLLAYRVPEDYEPSAETGKAWEGWFESLGSALTDRGYGVLDTRTLGNLNDGTRLGGYSIVTAGDLAEATVLARGCPGLRLGGGVEIGAVPDIEPRAGTRA
jgi:hypothetical protein